MEFTHSTVETLPLRKDQLIAIKLAVTVGIISGLVVGYFRFFKLVESAGFNIDEFAATDTVLSVCFSVIGAALGSCSIGTRNTRLLVAWMPFGMMGAMGVFGIGPISTFPAPLFASWLSSLLVICSYHFLTAFRFRRETQLSVL